MLKFIIMKLKNFVEELRWRGMIHDVMPDTEAHLMEQMRSAYIGFDPTADSLHIGNLVPITVIGKNSDEVKSNSAPNSVKGSTTLLIGLFDKESSPIKTDLIG